MASKPPRLPPMVVIDAAKTVHRALTTVQRKMAPPSAQLLEMVFSLWRPYALGLIARLGIADKLADGPRSAADLAAESGCHPQALERILRALAHDGILAQPQPGRFALTALSQPLRSDHPQSVHHIMQMALSPCERRTWVALDEAVRSGAPQFEQTNGSDVWDYIEQDPVYAACFHGAMTELTRLSGPMFGAVYDFGQHRTLVDVGGGRGTLLSILLPMFPTLRGINFDLEIALEEAPELLRQAGVSSRCELIAGSFLETIPAGHDAYILKHIVHDLDDERVATLFANLKQAVPSGSTLLLAEMLVPETSGKGVHPSFLDMEMLLTFGGRERSASEYGELMAAHGFRMKRVCRTPSPMTLIVGERR